MRKGNLTACLSCPRCWHFAVVVFAYPNEPTILARSASLGESKGRFILNRQDATDRRIADARRAVYFCGRKCGFVARLIATLAPLFRHLSVWTVPIVCWVNWHRSRTTLLCVRRRSWHRRVVRRQSADLRATSSKLRETALREREDS